MDVDFTNKVVLVTGAGAGIGEATALLFAKLGASLSLVDKNEENFQNVADRCAEEKGLKPLTIVTDISTDKGVEKIVKMTIDHFGKLDVLVNNAGVCARTGIQRADMATFDTVFNTNVRGVYNLTRLLVPYLMQTKGNIVNVSSIAATRVRDGTLPYGMSKAALDHFTKLIALELAPHGVRVNAVSPGITKTNMVKHVVRCTDKEFEEWVQKRSTVIPMGEVCVGLDIARMIAHLASENSRFVTGVIVQVDGGSQFGGPNNIIDDSMK